MLLLLKLSSSQKQFCYAYEPVRNVCVKLIDEVKVFIDTGNTPYSQMEINTAVCS